MAKYHRLMNTDPEMWRTMGSPLHDPDVQPKFYNGSIVRRGGDTFRIRGRAIDMDGAITYDLEQVEAKVSTHVDALLAEHERQSQAANDAGTPLSTAEYVTQRAALANAPGLSTGPIVAELALLEGEPVWSVPEAELTELLPVHLSLGKNTRPAAGAPVERVGLVDSAHVAQEGA